MTPAPMPEPTPTQMHEPMPSPTPELMTPAPTPERTLKLTPKPMTPALMSTPETASVVVAESFDEVIQCKFQKIRAWKRKMEKYSNISANKVSNILSLLHLACTSQHQTFPFHLLGLLLNHLGMLGQYVMATHKIDRIAVCFVSTRSRKAESCTLIETHLLEKV